MYTTNQILTILKEKKDYLQKRYPISELGIFGSYARDGFEYIRLAHELEDTFSQRVDVVSRKGIKPHYLPYIEKSLIHV